MSRTISTSPSLSETSPSHRLRGDFSAMKLSFKWFGVRRTLSDQQKRLAAEPFGAESGFLSTGKKLIDTSHPTYKKVSQVRSQALQYFRLRSLPYPDAGTRLVRNRDLDELSHRMNEYREELLNAVAQLQQKFWEIKEAARRRLGSLFVESDYPESLTELFDMQWEFPSVDPPNYLMQLSPEIYSRECERVTARFNEAIELAEGAFMDELGQLISHLQERLSGQSDGKPKIFRDSVVENFSEFINRFRQLNVRSNRELDELVERAGRVLRGVQPEDLRSDQQLRQRVSTQLSSVQSILDGLMVDRPRRRILRDAASSRETP